MMKKAAGILLLVLLLTIAGCSNKQVIQHNYTYTGENELWTAEYKFNGTGTFADSSGTLTYESSSDAVLTVTYKKDVSELASVKTLKISYESNAEGGASELNFTDGPPTQKTYTLKSSGRGGAIEIPDEIIKVSISVDGNTQTIELKNKK